MRPECQSCPVRRKGLCASISDEQLSELGTIKRPLRHFPAGAYVFMEHDDNNLVFLVRRGWAAVSSICENGRRQVLRFIMPGNFVGFEAAPDGSMPCTVEALTDLVMCPVPRQQLVRFCQHAPNVALRIASLLASETISDWHLLGGLGSCTAMERVARLLLSLGSRQHADAPVNTLDIALPVSQMLIADATGLTSVHVCRTLKDMRTAGLLVFTKGRLRVLDWDRLIEIAGMNDAGRPQPMSASRTGEPQRPLPDFGKSTAPDAFIQA
jgi:CRP-like cAMP-binding protein